MKKLFMVLAATVICGACVFTSCKKQDNLNLEEKMIGKWMTAEVDGQPVPTNEMWVISVMSPTKAILSASLNERPEIGTFWLEKEDVDISISGNKVTLTMHPAEHTTLVEEYDITSINDTEMSANLKMTTSFDGETSLSTSMLVRLTKVTADYTIAILGTWQGHCTSEGSVFDDGEEHRWEYRADGTYVYYVLDGDNWVPYSDDFAEYFVDGNLLCTRWRNSGEETENREWWEITVDGNRMNWTALRQNADGTTFTATFEMERVN